MMSLEVLLCTNQALYMYLIDFAQLFWEEGVTIVHISKMMKLRFGEVGLIRRMPSVNIDRQE